MRKKVLFLASLVLILSSVLWIIISRNEITFNENLLNTRYINESEVYKEKNKNKVTINTSSVSMDVDINPKSAVRNHYEGTEYPYFILNSNEDILSGVFSLQVNKNTDLKIVSLKGNELAPIRLPQDKEWFSNLKYTETGNNMLKIPFEIDMSINNSEDILLIPIINDNFFYSGEHSGVIRLVTIDNVKINNAMIEEQTISDVNIETFHPRPSIKLTDQNGNTINEVMREEQLYLSKDWAHLELANIMYDTIVDILWIDEEGKTEIIAENVQLNKNNNFKLEIKKKYLDIMEKNTKRQFFVVVNNRNQKVLADSEAFNQKKKPTLTTFQLIKEILPRVTD
ncbi:hypothetical protein NKT34_21025 [Paenibacillus polysaccharolyticus]|uniref:hypothetical protein n=1 Tax=Paenibacillus polysaccharolyticus TaxID=582692 RepID=UPI0012B910AE|nr:MULTISPECIES: hypothetical protein [Paenibacillus]MCP1135787.1 hypothetical protein [Paenibacillus polysaccharolyticus]